MWEKMTEKDWTKRFEVQTASLPRGLKTILAIPLLLLGGFLLVFSVYAYTEPDYKVKIQWPPIQNLVICLGLFFVAGQLIRSDWKPN